MHTYIHAYIHAYMHTYIHAYIHTCIHTCIHTYIHTYIHTCIHTYIHAYIRTYIHTYIQTYIYTNPRYTKISATQLLSHAKNRLHIIFSCRFQFLQFSCRFQEPTRRAKYSHIRTQDYRVAICKNIHIHAYKMVKKNFICMHTSQNKTHICMHDWLVAICLGKMLQCFAVCYSVLQCVVETFLTPTQGSRKGWE